MFLLQVLVVQALRPDRLQSAMSLFASKALGKFVRVIIIAVPATARSP